MERVEAIIHKVLMPDGKLAVRVKVSLERRYHRLMA
jgi:hypothetical protein